MDSSFFSKASSSKHNLLPTTIHELPRWRSPSPMAASMIPPPIVQSTYSTPPRKPTQQSPVVLSKPAPLRDRQIDLEADLQFLLDAQAEGLVRGLEGGGIGVPDDQTSTGSTTPTAQSVRSASVAARRASRPARRKPGLRSARKGIYNAILALSTVKDEELQGFDEDVREKKKTLEQVEGWEKKRQGLVEATKTIDLGEDTIRVQRLRSEANILQEEISHVELQLADMKARHRKLIRQATAVENSVQAKLASYNSSLRMLEEDVQKFLSFKPTAEEETSSRPLPREGPQSSIWELPPKRRTLEMARQHWSEERENVLRQREGAEHEKAALDEGAIVWKEVVADVTDFERRMRGEMAKLSAATGSSQDDGDASQRLRELLDHITRLTDALDSKFELAKDRNWNLLIAAIGAELDALKQGRQLLESVLLPSSNQQLVEEENVVETTQRNGSSPAGGDEIHELDKSFETARRPMSNGTHSSDEDPDPELLFSTHDTDTE